MFLVCLSVCLSVHRGTEGLHVTTELPPLPPPPTTQEGPPQDLFKLVHLENPLPHTCSNLGTPWTNSSLFTWGTPTPKTCSNLFIWGPPDLFKFVHLGNQHPFPYLLESGRLAFDRKAFMITALNR